MTEEEINKIIAEYMGWHRVESSMIDTYVSKCFNYSVKSEPTESLDALVPVFEKIYKEDYCEPIYFRLSTILNGEYMVETIWAHHDGDIPHFKNMILKSPSLALATACAEVIKELH